MKIFLAIYFILFSGVFANPQAPFEVKSKLTGDSLTQHFQIFEDSKGDASFASIQEANFKNLDSITNLGYSSSVFWLKLTVENTSDKKVDWFLVSDSPVIDFIELYSPDSEAPLKTQGDRVSFHTREINYRTPIFSMEQDPTSQSIYYIKIQSQSTIALGFFGYSNDELINFIINEQIVYGIYYGWVLVMILYNLFLYISTRYKSYLFYVLFISSFAMFQFILNGFAFQYFWPESTTWANLSLLLFMVLANMFGSLFTVNFLKTRTTVFWLYRIYQIVWAIGCIVFISMFILPYSLAIKIASVFTACVATLMFGDGIYAITRGIKVAKIFLTAFSVLIIGAILYALKSAGILPSNPFTNWTIQIGSSIEVALLSLGLANKINELTGDIEVRVKELNETNQKLFTSENRFRELFHGVGDMIFVLDHNWNFIDMNRTVTRHLGFKPEEVRGKNILEFIYKSKDIKDTYNSIFVLEKLEELLDTGKPVDFQAEFRQKFVMEPKELYVKLQHVQLDENKEILGTASVLVEDVIGRYLTKERISFKINNYLRNAEIISQKITAHISKFSDGDTMLGVRTSLREIIINAIEHGNLNISFDEKTQVMATGNYLQFIQQRQVDPRYKDKLVTIEYVLDSKKVAFRITDEGKGFDHKKMMEAKMEKLNEANVQHGRGIMMTRDVFDIIEYNDKGNQVSLVKYFR
ncbi:7TM diverse intracellular signaling domain-containing protein [Leptospira sp. GIMC2001]|uniref:7TM diverse intracellular signaling domain-containing protein n=1 Tax=Leptospira sp. GIMC2001 TaxID=1513297 RepID=UPI00234C00D0|nr:7TM diverse intracellular signaling domain-containing protein [Leptospira sp. GIMC2001]WCL50242.1 ATP-binding protein [Leptospira sp. GIMC2001]